MPKRTIENLVTSLMRWEPLAVENSEGRAWIKTLAKDPEDGSKTAMIKFDAGFKQAETTSDLAVDMYVLEGGMRCGDLTFVEDSFHYRPAGTRFGPIDCREGCTRLVFSVGRGRTSPSEPVFIQDVKQMPWSSASPDGAPQARNGQKTMRQDQDGGILMRSSVTWELGARGYEGLLKLHDYQEEAYLVEGAIWKYFDRIDGHMRGTAGTYDCRAPHESWHGDTLITEVPARFVVRYDYSTSKGLPLNIEQAARKRGDEVQHDEDVITIEPSTFAE
jgi:hypothetical protein